MAEHLRVDEHDGIRTLTIDRPEVKNALTRRMRDGLCDLLAAADEDPAVNVVVLTAVDPVFSAGVDFKEVAAAEPASPASSGSDTNPGETLRAMTTPVIAAVNGACVTGALELALSCSFVIASERARFADTHARLGVMATWGLTALLPRAVGVRMATEMSLTGNLVDADTALRVGLVNRVVAHDELWPTAYAVARDVAPGDAARAIARFYRDTEDETLTDAFRLGAARAAEVNADLRPEAFGAAGRAAARRSRA